MRNKTSQVNKDTFLLEVAMILKGISKVNDKLLKWFITQ